MSERQEPESSLSSVAGGPALRTMKIRRRRVVRNALSVLLVLAVIIVASLHSRNEQAIESCKRRMEHAARVFQDQRPDGFPMRGPDGASDAELTTLRDHVYYNWLYMDSSRAEVGVCCCREPHARFIGGEPVRHVIVYVVSTRLYEFREMPESQFTERADDLGLRASP
ncbi:MAG: hypothetical protein AB1716_18055 [Planctomycetota bacterium]